MESLAPLRRFAYTLIGRFYQFAYRNDRDTTLGPTWAGVLRWATTILVLVSWWRGWGIVGLVLTIGLAILVRFAFWIAKRRDYLLFVPQKTAVSPQTSAKIEPLPPNEKIQLDATGRFSTNNTETLALHRPTSYWQLPLGDHALMVEIENGRFHYQFFAPHNLVQVTVGWLIHGNHPQPAIAVTFQTEWGPDFADNTLAYYIRSRKKTDNTTRQHTIYLHFQNPQAQHRVQSNLLNQLPQN